MLKVVTLVGTRPELIKLSLVIAELDRQLDHVFVHSGQNYDYGLNEVFFEDLRIRRPDHFLEAAGESASLTIARVIERFDNVLELERPDAVLVLGDTNTGLGVLAAKRRRIPIFHMEAGNRCFDQRVPEEVNRKIIDHVSDINLVYTEHARRHLLAEGLRPDAILKTGSPMREVLSTFAASINASEALSRHGLARDRYFLASAHREETVDDASRLSALLEAFASLASEHEMPLLYSAHPRTRSRIREFGLLPESSVTLVDSLGFFDYVHLQKNAFCVLSDSGTITEESAILGFPAVMVRDVHERPEGMDEGTLIMAGIYTGAISEAVRVVRSQHEAGFRSPPDYEPTDVARKVVRIILSYTGFVQRTVWRSQLPE